MVYVQYTEIQWYCYDYHGIVSQNAVFSYYSKYFKEYSGITIVQVHNTWHYHAIV